MWLSKSEAERNVREKRALKGLIKEYREFLEKECGFEQLSARDSLAQHESYVGNTIEYEKVHERTGLLSYTTVGDIEYDIRYSKYNRLAVEKYKLEQELQRLRLAVFLFKRIVEKYQAVDEKNVRQSFKLLEKVEKDFGIDDDVVSLYSLCDGLLGIGGEPDSLEERIRIAEKCNGRPLNKERIKKIEKEIEITNAQNKLLDDFDEYLKHKECSGLRCSIGEKEEKCVELRKRFQRHQFETDLMYEGFSKKKIKEICDKE